MLLILIKISFCSSKLPDSLSIWLFITASKHWERPCKSKPVNDMGGKYKSKVFFFNCAVYLCFFILFCALSDAKFVLSYFGFTTMMKCIGYIYLPSVKISAHQWSLGIITLMIRSKVWGSLSPLLYAQFRIPYVAKRY